MKKLLPVFIVFALVSLAVAEGTRQWKETGYDEFEKGTARGIAIRSTGQIETGTGGSNPFTPVLHCLYGVLLRTKMVWFTDAATGAPGRVYRVTPEGKSTVIFEPKELQVQSIALGQDGAVYAATSPDGKVYRITRKPGGTASTPEFRRGNSF